MRRFEVLKSLQDASSAGTLSRIRPLRRFRGPHRLVKPVPFLIDGRDLLANLVQGFLLRGVCVWLRNFFRLYLLVGLSSRSLPSFRASNICRLVFESRCSSSRIDPFNPSARAEGFQPLLNRLVWKASSASRDSVPSFLSSETGEKITDFSSLSKAPPGWLFTSLQMSSGSSRDVRDGRWSVFVC